MTPGHGGDGFLSSYYSYNRLGQVIDAKRNQQNLRVWMLKDLLNFNEACETAITIFNKMVEGLSVCWSGPVHGEELMTYLCVWVWANLPDY